MKTEIRFHSICRLINNVIDTAPIVFKISDLLEFSSSGFPSTLKKRSRIHQNVRYKMEFLPRWQKAKGFS